LVQPYAVSHRSLFDAAACNQQVSWYACTPAGDDKALALLLCASARNCMLATVENGCGWYGDVLLLRATEAAGHVPVESSGTVAQSVMFIACMSSVLQVPQPLLLFTSRFV
jgi:hypothetical protein